MPGPWAGIELFSIHYILTSIRVILQHPSSLWGLSQGITGIADSLDVSWREKWAENPIRIKHLHNFDICLDEEDVYGPSPAIGVAGTHEPHVTELFNKLLREGQTVVDVGANMGWFTLHAATSLRKKGRVIAFEPEPSNFMLLSRSLELNSLRNVELLQLAVSDREGHEILYLAQGNIGGHSTIRHLGSDEIEVPSTTLDLSLGKLGVEKIQILKVDVEGGEPSVILGARSCLSAVDNLIMEWNPESWANQTSTLNALFESFHAYEIVRSPFLIRRISRESVSQLPLTNLYFRKKTGS